MSSRRAAVAGFKKCSRVHIDKSVYDFAHRADSAVLLFLKLAQYAKT